MTHTAASTQHFYVRQSEIQELHFLPIGKEYCLADEYRDRYIDELKEGRFRKGDLQLTLIVRTGRHVSCLFGSSIKNPTLVQLAVHSG